jgi:hypothetical protein
MWEAAHYIYQGLRATKVQGVINTKLDFFSQLPKGGEGCECVLLCVCVCVCALLVLPKVLDVHIYTHGRTHTHTPDRAMPRAKPHPYHSVPFLAMILLVFHRPRLLLPYAVLCTLCCAAFT